MELVPDILQFLQLGLFLILTFLEQLGMPGIGPGYLSLDKLLFFLRKVLLSPGIILFHADLQSIIGGNTQAFQVGEVVDFSLVSGLDSILLFGDKFIILLSLPCIQILDGLTFGITAILSKLPNQSQPSLILGLYSISLSLAQPGKLFHQTQSFPASAFRFRSCGTGYRSGSTATTSTASLIEGEIRHFQHRLAVGVTQSLQIVFSSL